MPLHIFLVGQTERSEAQPLAEWLAESLRSAVQQRFSELSLVLDAASRTNTIPDLIVIVQSQPDEFSPTDIARLFAFAPLARVVVACGAWCESDGRTRNHWPLAVRVSLLNATARIEREWQLLNEACGVEPLPLSASREEVFAADHSLIEPTDSKQTVLVVSPDPAYRRFLHELLTAAGHSTCEVIRADSHPSASATAILFDADPWTEAQADHVRMLRQQHPQAKIVALMSAPQPSHAAALLAAGAFAVTPKLGDQTAIVSAF